MLQTYTFSTCGSSFDSFVHVYTNDGNWLGTEVAACDDCGPCGTQAVLTVPSLTQVFTMLRQGLVHTRCQCLLTYAQSNGCL